MTSVIKRHPNLFYFLFAFLWTWILAFSLIFTHAVEDVSKPTPVFVLVGILSGIAPSLSAILVTWLAKGREGLKQLFGQVKRPASGGLVALALLTVPVILVLTTVLSHLVVRRYTFSLTVPLLAVGLVWPLFSCLGEEFGWRGFILPQLLARFGTLKASLILGVIWATWHLPMYWIGYQHYGAWTLGGFLIPGYLNLIAQSAVMAWLYARSNGSLKLTLFYHYTITASAILKGAFLSTDALPKSDVLESAISVLLFTAWAIFLYRSGQKAENP